MILEGEIKDAKLTDYSSDFQTLTKHLNFYCVFLWIINEFEKYVSCSLLFICSASSIL